MRWLSEERRYHLALRGEESWLRSGYPIQIWFNGHLAATIFPRRRRTREGMPKKKR